MNDELQKKLVEYLGSVEKMANDAVLFGKAEIPQYLQELIRWEIVSHGMWAAALFIATAVCVGIVVAAIKNVKALDDAIAPLVMFPLFGAAVSVCFCFSHIEDASKAYFAPRVLLVEKLSAMVRK